MTREKFKTLMAEYGRVALGTYLGIFVLTLVGFAVAIQTGVEVQSAGAGAGVLGAAYLATKVTQPIRIGGTLLLTPIVARVLRKYRPVTSSEQSTARSPEPGGASSSES